MSRPPGFRRDLLELLLGYGLIVGVIWMPEHWQRICSPIVLVVTLAIVLVRGATRDELGFGLRGLLPSLWILPAAAALAAISVIVAKAVGTFHPLYHADFNHVAGYVLWTIYQQFLLNDYFLPRLMRILNNDSLVLIAVGVLFAAAHLPNLWLALVTLAWGVISCILFRRYRNLYALGLAQGLLGLCFAICIPNSIHHHLRVGLGYLRYRQQ